MKSLSFGTTALMGLLALMSGPLTGAVASAGATAPSDASLVLTFKPRPGKGPEVLSMMNDAADYIHENQPGALSAYGFKVSGKEEYVFVERYDSLENLQAWGNSQEHTNMIRRFFPLLDIFGSRMQSSVSLGDLLAGFNPAP